MSETVSFETCFVAKHRDVGGTKQHNHKYIVEMEATYVKLPADAAETLEDVVYDVVGKLQGVDLNELLEQSELSFWSPTTVNMARYVLYRVRPELQIVPDVLCVVLTEINAAKNTQRAVKMIVRK